MAIDGVNGNQNVNQVNVMAKLTDGNESKVKAKLSEDLQFALRGGDKTEDREPVTMSRNERKAWIKEYCQTHDCSKKEAKAAFDQEFGKLDKMSRKEAKAWVKNYMEENGCSKKDAKKAFKEEFGYDVPRSILGRIGRAALVGLTGPVAFIASMADGVTDGKVGIKKFIDGESNNDAAYVKRDDA